MSLTLDPDRFDYDGRNDSPGIYEVRLVLTALMTAPLDHADDEVRMREAVMDNFPELLKLEKDGHVDIEFEDPEWVDYLDYTDY